MLRMSVLIFVFLSSTYSFADSEKNCSAEIKQYVMGLLALDGFPNAQVCAQNVGDCLQLIEPMHNDAMTYVATYEFGGNYPNFNIYYVSVDQFCQISNIRFVRQ